ncbi:phage tail tape measure protein [Wolbachia endosymbiont (group A) of Anoplius nigerrimus]|uniref:phage tail tape measure protein n=1 Tax=Wolbachia endosymbiont (group A) of Anoplius nigerrimus TaxID=2953979 RepID=UPI002231A80A|nr:phage tail tape measure protein [Wolbachia endosymbiont (group A) of Anoplius nigerrimus]
MSTLSVKIGAILDGSFNSAMAGSSAQLSRLGGTIRQLDTSMKSVSKFKELSSGVSVAGQSWRKLERRVKALAQEMKKTEKPSKDLKAKFDKASASVVRARTDYLKKKGVLRSFSEELRKSGRDIKSLIRDQDKLGASAEKLRSQYTKLNSAIKKRDMFLGKKAYFKSQMLETAGLALTLAAPVKVVIDFENAIADIKAVIKLSDDKEDNDREFIELGKMLKGLSRTIPLSAAELAQITTSGARLGIKEKKDLLEFTEIVSKMAVNFGMSVEQIGSDVSSFYNIYKMSLKDLRNFGDLVNHLASNTSVEPKDLMAGINIASGAARQFGLEIEQIAGLVNAFVMLGKQPKKAAEMINGVLVKLQTAGKQGDEFRETLGSVDKKYEKREKDGSLA